VIDPYTTGIVKLQGFFTDKLQFARLGATTLWNKLNSQRFCGKDLAHLRETKQYKRAGLVYLSWQVAADANVAAKYTLTNLCHPAIVFRL
jgi:isocitrate lyase